MMSIEDVASGSDVTICLVHGLSTTGLGNTGKQTITSLESEVEQGLPIAKIHANSSRLRQCSKYFETCMSGRWTKHTREEFQLEVQTDVLYYQDCFSRMSFPFKSISSVKHCIELLKVASQLEYQEVMDIGVRYLSAAPWSDDEEMLIRNFCKSGHLSMDSASDLSARLQLSLTPEERQKELLTLTQSVLSQYLHLSMYSYDGGNLVRSRKLFAETFYAILSGSGTGTCQDLLQFALTLVKEAAEKFLIALGGVRGQKKRSCIERGALNFYWLFKISRKANAAQGVAELVVKYGDVPENVRNALFAHPSTATTQKKWAKMIYSVFQDVLQGHLFLTTSERITLFQQWYWIMEDEFVGPDIDGAHVAQLIFRMAKREQELTASRHKASPGNGVAPGQEQ